MNRKQRRIEETKRKAGSRNDRKLKKYSEKFNKMFNFYLSVYRTGLITFCGVGVDEIESDPNGAEGRYAFREYDNGRYKQGVPPMRHPNILRAIIIGKKGWGLWCKQWAEGIGQCLFTKHEILEEFREHGIVMPESIETEFSNLIWDYRFKHPELQEEHEKMMLNMYKNLDKSK